ncbi:methionyl-tRNA formyltransferase [Winogradskya consettensis]|uniref:Methionyl-tRNA formyltransferase n=1 Tax=Winogradskya consettensis TaxID=113560 RepID=A0A919VR94_9ACTN|nr:methionyl-tRNA formyltransferase [Actinoplanes consettensis]GIM72927.1 methionyl-tRNA formyltransferase [Actinoplanes consettensis]
MRIVFFGYGVLGAVALDGLLAAHTVALVITHPADFSGLGEPDVQDLAERHGLPVVLSAFGAEPDLADRIRAAAPDLVVSTNWRTRLPADLLSLAPLGALNVHDALLPKYSGFGAINWAIRNGEAETGVTVHVMEPDFDSGPVMARTVVAIGPDELAGDLYERVTAAYVPTLTAAIEARSAGSTGTPQDPSARTFYHRIGTGDVRIDWTLPSLAAYALVRAQSDPYVNAWTTYDGDEVRVKAARLPESAICGTPGRLIRRTGDGVTVGCGPVGAPGSRGLVLLTVQPAGSGELPAADYFKRMGGYLL